MPVLGQARVARALLVAACVAVSAAANGQSRSPSGDPASGRTFAFENCAACHEVEDRRPLHPLLPNAPAFVAIANAKGTTAISLSAFLNTSHKTKPNFILSSGQQRDVISYILSLRNPP